MEPRDAEEVIETHDPPHTKTDVPGSFVETTAHSIAPGTQASADVTAVIGKYRVIERLGAGGQGEVYRAVHPSLGRDVVVKWAAKSLPESARQQLIEEGRVLARLEDPGLVRVYDVDVCDGRPFIVFEYLQGNSLAELLRRDPPKVRDAVRLTARIGQIVARIHERGVLHRDLKPANILLDALGQPRLLDFGLASMSQPYREGNGTETWGLVGTLSYMPPEQANSQTEKVGPRSDQFSLAAILYEMLTGRPPYTGSTYDSVWDQAREGIVVSPRQRNPQVPRAVEQICLKAMTANPADRFPSVGAFGRALEGYLARPRRLMVAGALLFATLAGLLTASWHISRKLDKDLVAQPKPGLPDESPKPTAPVEQPAVTVPTEQPNATQPLEQPKPPVPLEQPKPAVPARAKPPAGWIDFELPIGGYRVFLPGKPKQERSTIKSKSGPQEMIQVSLHDAQAGIHYSVTYTEFVGRTFSDVEKAMDAGRDGAVSNVDGTVLSEKKLQLGEHPGRDVVIAIPKFPSIRMRMHFFVIGQKVYQVMVGGSENQIYGPEAKRFFESFQLLAEKQ